MWIFGWISVKGFDRQHRLMTTALLLGAQGMLFLSQEFTTWIWVPSMALTLLSPLVQLPQTRPVSRLFLAAFIVPAPVLAWLAWQTGNYLFFAIMYAVVLSVLKSFQLRRANDFLQLYALILLLIVAAAVVNPGPGFGILFVPVSLLLTLCLVANNLRRGVEASFMPEHRADVLARRDIFSRAFVLTATGVSLMSFAGAVALFMAIPRFDPGFFNPAALRGLSVSGFSDDVDLNSRAPIIEDKRVVMRVHIVKGDLHPPIRLRGLSYATYLSGKWHKVYFPRSPVYIDKKGRFIVPYSKDKKLSGPTTILDITSNVWGKQFRPVFGVPDMMSLEIKFSASYKNFRFVLKGDGLGSVVIEGTGHKQIMYREYSRTEDLNPVKLRRAGTNYVWWTKEYFLQQPKDLSPRIRALARRITKDMTTPYDKTMAIRNFLRANIDYSLSPPQGTAAPLVDFLFNEKKGPCEFYATAMVMMLRGIDIPSRIVSGFYGGTPGKYGDLIEIHASDAHSWVEVYFPGHGFITMDPTPPSIIEKRNKINAITGINSLITKAKLWWYRWVVKYSLKKQAALLLSMLTGDKNINTDPYAMATRFKRLIKGFSRSAPAVISRTGIGAGAFLALLLLLYGLFLLFKRRKKPGRSYFRRAERLLANRGLTRMPGQTPQEFCELVKHRFPVAQGPFEELVDIYYQDLFGHGLKKQQTERIPQILRAIKMALPK